MRRIKFQFDGTMIGEGIALYEALLVLDHFAIYRRDDNFYLDTVKPVQGTEDVFTDNYGTGTLFVPLGKIGENQPAPTLEEVAEKLLSLNGLELLCRHFDAQEIGISLFT